MPTTMIRVEQSTHKRLRALAACTGRSIPQLVATVVEEFERKIFWEQVNVEFGALRRNSRAWKQEVEERTSWDAALSDGPEE